MIEGSRRPIASTPLTRPRRAPKPTPATAASQGLTPATIISAAMTAEKLNIHPTERSISRIASRNTIPSDSMPWNVVLPRIVSRLIGLRKRGRATPMTAIITSKARMTPISSGNPKSTAGAKPGRSRHCGFRRPTGRPSRYFCHGSDSDAALQLGMGACSPSLIHRNWPLTDAASSPIRLMMRSAAFSGSSPPVCSTQSAHC